MTTDDAKANAVHFAPERSVDPVACGDKNPASVTFYLEYTTCPACLAAMGEPRVPVRRGHCDSCDRCGWKFGSEGGQCRDGDCSMRPLPPARTTCAGCGAPFEDAEPRVVSGTDAVAATTEPTTPRMTMYDALQAFEAIRGTTRVGEAAHGIATLAVQQIRALGTVPAPAETPRPTDESMRAALDRGQCEKWAAEHPTGPHLAETPAPPGPEKPPTPDKCPACAKVARHLGEGYVCAWHGPGTCEVRECYGESVVVVDGHALCESHRLGRGADDPVPPAFLGAPAPGAGEGAHELTFAEAYPQCLAKPGSVECQDGDGRWTEFKPVFPWTPETVLMVLGWSYRLKPEPLPAPAPKPGRVAGMVKAWERDSVEGDTFDKLCERVAREALACVRRRLRPYRHEVIALSGELDAAALELLGAEAGK